MKGTRILLMVALMLVLLTIQDVESKKMNMEEAKKSIKNLRKPCSKKNDTPKELLDGQHRGEFPQDKRLMCYLQCILVATKTMKGDDIVWDFFAKNTRLLLLEEYIPRVEHVVDVCQSQVTATDGCETAWQFAKCTFETDSELYVIP